MAQNVGGVDPDAFAVGAPPVYGEHHLDFLYDDLDPAGYMTPAGGLSGVNTPFNSQSRRGSADNLASMGATTTTGVLPIALQSRLSSLDNTPTNPVPENRAAGVSGSSEEVTSAEVQAPSSSNASPGIPRGESRQVSGDTLPRRTSENGSENSGSDPQHFEISPEELSKVPSYSTALRSRPQTATCEVPPPYQSSAPLSLSPNPTVYSSDPTGLRGGRRLQH